MVRGGFPPKPFIFRDLFRRILLTAQNRRPKTNGFGAPGIGLFPFA